jgi:hypothetical protein
MAATLNDSRIRLETPPKRLWAHVTDQSTYAQLSTIPESTWLALAFSIAHSRSAQHGLWVAHRYHPGGCARRCSGNAPLARIKNKALCAACLWRKNDLRRVESQGGDEHYGDPNEKGPCRGSKGKRLVALLFNFVRQSSWGKCQKSRSIVSKAHIQYIVCQVLFERIRLELQLSFNCEDRRLQLHTDVNCKPRVKNLEGFSPLHEKPRSLGLGPAWK